MTGLEEFDWQSLWPEGSGSKEWSHSGIAVLRNGTVVFCAPAGGVLVFVTPHSDAITTLPTALLEIHGISVDTDPDEWLWLCDPGEKPRANRDYDVERRPGTVLRLSLGDGSLEETAQPNLPAYTLQPWRPTSAVADRGGGVWVADGYGASLVHKFDRSGRHLFSLDGEETGTRFACPHGIVLDGRRSPAVMIVADRGNGRLVAYDLDGTLNRVIDSAFFTTPSSLAMRGDDLLVAELNGGLLSLDLEDVARPVVLPLAAAEHQHPWPNTVNAGRLVRPDLDSHRLHSPHGLAVGPDGSIYLTEWLIGGRQLRLRPGTEGGAR
jgi:sugar lactone lactonase YvrE